MRFVYTLHQEMVQDPGHVKSVHALTLSAARPNMGLKNVHGLYGSPKWWENIYSGKIPGHKVSGVITEMLYAGMDSRRGDEVNAFSLKLDDGSTIFESIYADTKADEKLFQVGATVNIIYALLELKMQPASDGGINYSKTVIEMSIST